MRVRTKRSESSIRRRREALAHATASRTPEPYRRRRELAPLQDHAVYECGCGFVFEATVTTSVGCPHCGGPQAW